MQGRVALVTGASSGIGWTTAEVAARSGARVMAVARREERLSQLAAETGVATLAVSLTDEDGCRRAVSETEARLGPVEILITVPASARAPRPRSGTSRWTSGTRRCGSTWMRRFI